jgi:uncharacterized protein (TIGR03000 family)
VSSNADITTGYPPSFYKVPTEFNRPTYYTSINYPWLYGGHMLHGGPRGATERDALPVTYRLNHSTFNPSAPLPAYNSQYSISGTRGLYTNIYTSRLTPTPATIDLHVPPSADIWIQGRRLDADGTHRHFVSPPLNPDLSYTLDIRAAWRENGEARSFTQQFSVRAGDHKDVDLLSPTDSTMRPVLRAAPLPAGR